MVQFKKNLCIFKYIYKKEKHKTFPFHSIPVNQHGNLFFCLLNFHIFLNYMLVFKSTRLNPFNNKLYKCVEFVKNFPLGIVLLLSNKVYPMETKKLQHFSIFLRQNAFFSKSSSPELNQNQNKG